MLVMLCTRCQQREAKVWPAEKRAEIEAKLGTPWPFPDDLCKECWREWLQTPEAKQRMETFRRAMMERFWKDVEKWEGEARSAALKVLDVADAIVGKP